jgi:hypothetical protein
MTKGYKNLKKTRAEIIEILKRNGVAIGTETVAAGTVVTLLDEETGERISWDGNLRDDPHTRQTGGRL